MRPLLWLALNITVCQFVFAQNASTSIGARANALGYASACLTDEWSMFNNVGGLANTTQTTVGFTYDAQPQFQAFNRVAAVLATPVKFGVAGIGVFKFGDDLYNEQILTGGFSNRFGLASLGLKVNYIQYNIEGFGRKGLVSVSFGGLAELTPRLLIGAHIVNLNQPDVGEEEKLPTILVAGMAYKASDKVFVTTEVEKDLDFEPKVKSGLEYHLDKKFIFRTGFNLNPNAGFMGLGFRPRKFSLDYAYSYVNIGSRHQATVGYKFKENNQKQTKS